MIGTFTKNIHRHEANSVISAPATRPDEKPVAATAEMRPAELQTLGVQLLDMPASITEPLHASALSASVYWRYAFVKTIYTELSVNAERASGKSSTNCPDVPGCAGEASSTVKMLHADMGVGVQW